MGFLTDPISWWIDPFTGDAAMQRALLAGVLVALTTSVIGVWVILRGMSFLGDALAHGVLPGIAITFVIGANTTVGAFAAALAMIAGVNLIRKHSPLPEDTSIGVLFVGFLALAVVIMSSASPGYEVDLNRFLFGSVATVETADVVRQAVVAILVVVGVVVLYRPLIVLTFDSTQAQFLGMKPKLVTWALLIMLSLAIVASFESVGSLLVFAFLIAPPAAATLVTKGVPQIIGLAALLGVASAVVGLLISYHHDTAGGATMALVAVCMFFLVLLWSAARTAVRTHRGTLEPATHH